MRFAMITLLALAAAVAPRAPISAADGYAGQQARAIKALASEDVADLLAGRGMGLAKAGELNHYPGPAHVIELRDKLDLTPGQLSAVQASFERMSAAAKPLGAELIERERALDRAFADGTVTGDTLADATAAIGALQGRLRAVHLVAHLETRAVLTPAQIARYDTLRGYSDVTLGPSEPSPHHHHGG
jgi:hypothetical protein